MGNTSIEWTNKTWSPLRARVRADAGEIAKAKGYTSLVRIAEKMVGHVGPHCEHVSDGCVNCYSGTNNHRCLPKNGTGLPFDRRSRDLIEPILDKKIILQPLSWKAPQRIFVENQSDLFGEWVTDEQIDRVFSVMALCPQHTFQCLTKRPGRMYRYLGANYSYRREQVRNAFDKIDLKRNTWGEWPLPNVHLGVSVEDQKTADERILLLRTPAAKRFVSYEPALGPVDFYQAVGDSCWLTGNRLHQIIVGGESGPGARPFDIQWARNTIAQCKAAGVACFVKQLGAKPYCNEDSALDDSWPEWSLMGTRYEITLKDRKGGDMKQWPQDLRVRKLI